MKEQKKKNTTRNISLGISTRNPIIECHDALYARCFLDRVRCNFSSVERRSNKQTRTYFSLEERTDRLEIVNLRKEWKLILLFPKKARQRKETHDNVRRF